LMRIVKEQYKHTDAHRRQLSVRKKSIFFKIFLSFSSWLYLVCELAVGFVVGGLVCKCFGF